MEKNFKAVVEILREVKVGAYKVCTFIFDNAKDMHRFLDNLQYDPSFIKLVHLKYEGQEQYPQVSN